MSHRAPTVRMFSGLLLSLLASAGVQAQVVVCVDPGHGGVDPGALGCDAIGMNEEDVNLDVGLKLEALLEADPDFTPLMTRSSDTGVELYQRAAFANDNGVQRFVSIHANAANGPASGIETFCAPNGSDASFSQRNAIQTGMTALWPELPDRGGKTANWTVLSATWMPATLSELAFIDNCYPDAALLADGAQRQAAAVVHWQALRESLGLSVGQGGGAGATPSPDDSEPQGGSESTPPASVSTGTLTGVVYEDFGAGDSDMSVRVGGASVTVSGPPGVATVQTHQATGLWLFNLTPGEWMVNVDATGYAPATRYCVVVQGQTTWCSVGLSPTTQADPGEGTQPDSGSGSGDAGASPDGEDSSSDAGAETPVDSKGYLLGVVRDAQSLAGISAQLVISGLSDTHTVMTDPDGHWDLNVGAGTWVVTAMASGYETNSTTCQVLSGAAAICTLDLQPNHTSREPDANADETDPRGAEGALPSPPGGRPEPPRQAEVCGDGVCEGLEDRVNCGRDCEVVSEGCCVYTGTGVCGISECVDAVAAVDSFCADTFDSHCVSCANGQTSYEGLDCSAVVNVCGCVSGPAAGDDLDPFGSADGVVSSGDEGHAGAQSSSRRVESVGCAASGTHSGQVLWSLIAGVFIVWLRSRRRRTGAPSVLATICFALVLGTGCADRDRLTQTSFALASADGEQRGTLLESTLRAPIISPDGKRLVATTPARDELFVVNVASGESERLVSAPNCGYQPVWLDHVTVAYRVPGQRMSDVPLHSVRISHGEGPIPTSRHASKWLTFDDEHALWLTADGRTRQLTLPGERACCARASSDYTLVAFTVLGVGLQVYDLTRDERLSLGHGAYASWVSDMNVLIYQRVIGASEALAISHAMRSVFGAKVPIHEEISQGYVRLDFASWPPASFPLTEVPDDARNLVLSADGTWAAYDTPAGLFTLNLSTTRE